jgi:hypothetical protein
MSTLDLAAQAVLMMVGLSAMCLTVLVLTRKRTPEPGRVAHRTK